MRNKKFGLLSAVLVLALASHAAEASLIYNNVHTTNWAGYGVDVPPTGTHVFSSVSASWTVPTIALTTDDSYMGMWIGLDGLTDLSVEQIGILANSVSGSLQYYAFYELFPSDAVSIDTVGGLPFTITPGDSLSAQIAYSGVFRNGDLFHMTLTDNTTGQSFSQNVATGFVSNRSTAEWIVEAPTVDTGIATLSTFGSTSFTSASATLDGLQTGPISTFTNVGIDLVASSGSSAVASALDPTGSSFTVNETPEPSSLAFISLAGLFLRRRCR